LFGYVTFVPFASVSVTLYWTTAPFGCDGIAPLYVSFASAIATVASAPPRGRQVISADVIAGAGQAAEPPVFALTETSKFIRVGLSIVPIGGAPLARLCSANAAWIAHMFGVPFARSPSSSSPSSASG
jgi:hypothetical protein